MISTIYLRTVLEAIKVGLYKTILKEIFFTNLYRIRNWLKNMKKSIFGLNMGLFLYLMRIINCQHWNN